MEEKRLTQERESCREKRLRGHKGYSKWVKRRKWETRKREIIRGTESSTTVDIEDSLKVHLVCLASNKSLFYILYNNTNLNVNLFNLSVVFTFIL